MDNTYWDWKLRLFASADIAGSTAFKARRSEAVVPEWAPTFREFLLSFPDAVQTEYSRLPDKSPVTDLTLKPWKFSGDEAIFCVQLRNH